MNFKQFFILLTSILYSFSIFQLGYAQINWKIGAEAGYYSSSESTALSRDDFLSRLDGQIKYNYNYDKKNLSLQVKINPEFYGFENHLHTLNLKAAGSYYQNTDDYNWGVTLIRQRHSYSDLDLKAVYNIFFLTGDMNWYIQEEVPIDFRIGYGYQDISNTIVQKQDILYCNAKAFHVFNVYSKIGYGLYIERFSVEDNFIYNYNTVTPRRNIGWRYGALLSYNYLRRNVFSLEYRFLFHNSKAANHPSFEQYIRLLAGKIFFSRWSAFLLIDYYWRKFKSENDSEYQLRYTPMNLENRIYVKIAYELRDNVELYIRSGYSKEYLYNDRYSFSGFSALVGIDISY